jgi:hypothetical protein
MIDLKLEQDESIICHTNEAWSFDGHEERELESLYLTNKNLINVYEKHFWGGMAVDKIPLCSIVKKDNKFQIRYIIDDNFGDAIKIIYNNGSIMYFLGDVPKSDYHKWEKDIIDTTIKENAENANRGNKVTSNTHTNTINNNTEKHVGKDVCYCPFCGTQSNKNMRFCSKCGKALNQTVQEVRINSDDKIAKQQYHVERKQKYAGSIIKCPSCGQELTSFMAICPSCGHEINSSKVSDSLQDFVEQIENIEKRIDSNHSASMKISKAWRMVKKIGWVLLNICFACIPLLISVILRFFRTDKKPELTTEEKLKVSIIENYQFPNSRGDILDALVYIKGKVSLLASDTPNNTNAYWIKLWVKKAEGLYPGDKIANDAYSSIVKDGDRIKQRIKLHLLSTASIVVLLIILVQVRKATINNVNYSSEYELSTSGISLLLPELPTEYGKIGNDDENRFSIDVYQVSNSQFEEYVKACKAYGFNLYVTNTDSSFHAYNSDRYSLNIFYYDSDKKMDINLETPLKMDEIRWIETKLVNQIPQPDSLIGNIQYDRSTYFAVYIDNITDEQYSSYVDKCMNNGFNVDYTRNNELFYGYNEEGYYLKVRKEKFDEMYISIEAPKNK